jgi:hypothetical protein
MTRIQNLILSYEKNNKNNIRRKIKTKSKKTRSRKIKRIKILKRRRIVKASNKIRRILKKTRKIRTKQNKNSKRKRWIKKIKSNHQFQIWRSENGKKS